jgi:glycosyltransferase involved in cell wall biosynthesis
MYTIDTCGSGGAETVFLELLKGLDKEAYSPHVLLKGKGWLYDEVVKLGIRPEIVEMKGSFNVRYLLSIMNTIKRNKINLVHSHLFGSNVYCSLAGMICRVPVISTFHGTVDGNLNGHMLGLKFRLINTGSSRIVFVSNYLKEYYWSHTPVSRKKSLTIYNGIDCDRFSVPKNRQLRRELGYSDEDFLIGSIGNIRPAKGYGVLLKAAAIVIKRFPQCKFVVAGEGHGDLFQELLELRKNLGLERSVRFLGFRPDVENLLACLDLFVVPSTTEGFSISTIEAMAAGLAVVVTNSGGPGEIVTHLKDGILVDENSPEAIAEAIRLCLSDQQLRETLSSNSRKTVQGRFDMRTMIKRYLDLYDACLH